MTTNITFRQGVVAKPSSTTTKNDPLTNTEIDGNFHSIQDSLDSIEGNGWVTTARISDNQVTPSKLSTDTTGFKNKIGIQTSATGSTILAKGTIGERDSTPVEGYFRYNTSVGAPEWRNATDWMTVAKTSDVVYIGTTGLALNRASAAVTLNGVSIDGNAVSALTKPLTDSSTAIATTEFVKNVMQSMYPVGSIYINASNSTNPATLLGFGTWVSFGAGRVPVGFNASDPLFDTAEETGGSKDAIVVSHTHTFSGTTGAGGSHNHTIALYDNNTNVTGLTSAGTLPQNFGSATTSTVSDHTHAFSGTTASTGSSGTNANLPPYITVYMWKRFS